MSINSFGQTISAQAKSPDKPHSFGQQVSEQAHARNEARKAGEAQPVSDAQQAKTAQNRAILEASLEVSISSGNESMSLLFKAAIEKINEVLAPDLGPRPLDAAVESGLDVSPEATADRIVSLTTGLFARYQDANPELQGAALVDRFVSVISGGIEQGFTEAREILDGLGVLEGDIATNIDLTFDLVMEKLEQFRLDNGGAPTEPAADDTVAPTAADTAPDTSG